MTDAKYIGNGRWQFHLDPYLIDVHTASDIRKAYQYAKLLESGVEFPPIMATYNPDTQRWSTRDGAHRVTAHRMIGLDIKVMAEELPQDK